MYASDKLPDPANHLQKPDQINTPLAQEFLDKNGKKSKPKKPSYSETVDAASIRRKICMVRDLELAEAEFFEDLEHANNFEALIYSNDQAVSDEHMVLRQYYSNRKLVPKSVIQSLQKKLLKSDADPLLPKWQDTLTNYKDDEEEKDPEEMDEDELKQSQIAR